jgi:ABC-type nitrate/sulfonate/bicarbonate transport system substrate-binding protein
MARLVIEADAELIAKTIAAVAENAEWTEDNPVSREDFALEQMLSWLGMQLRAKADRDIQRTVTGMAIGLTEQLAAARVSVKVTIEGMA